METIAVTVITRGYSCWKGSVEVHQLQNPPLEDELLLCLSAASVGAFSYRLIKTVCTNAKDKILKPRENVIIQKKYFKNTCNLYTLYTMDTHGQSRSCFNKSLKFDSASRVNNPWNSRIELAMYWNVSKKCFKFHVDLQKLMTLHVIGISPKKT